MGLLTVWWRVLVALAAIRVAVPLVTLAAAGDDLPGLPAYEYRPLHGDSFGFYAAARELMQTTGELNPLVLAALVVTASIAAWLGRRLYHRGRRLEAVAATAVTLALVLTVPIDRMDPTGAAVLGWSVVWSLAMLPYRTLGLALDPDVAFAFGLTLSLAATAVATVATGYLGLHASGRRGVGLGAAALFALWPLFVPLFAGASAWKNGQWHADVGLHLYTEPLSTALVAVALALLLSPRLDELRLALAGVALGYATFTKLSNGLIALAAVLLVAWWIGPRRTLPLVVAGLAVVPLLAVYWSQGYPALENVPPWSADYVFRNWTDSLIFDPGVLVVLLVPALAGAWLLRHTRALPLLGTVILSTAVLYSFYEHTRLHPRFLYSVLPPLFVLQAVALVALVERASAGIARDRGAPGRV